MSLGEIRHGLDQAAREVRRRGLEPAPHEGPRCDLAFATLEELNALEAALLAADMAEVPRLADVVNERAASGEPPAREWTPAIRLELTRATSAARAEGRAVVPVTDDLHVELAFDPHDEPEDEPDPVPVEPEAELESLDEEPEPDPVVAAAVAPATPAKEERKPPRARPLGAMWALDGPKRWPDESDGGTLLERQF